MQLIAVVGFENVCCCTVEELVNHCWILTWRNTYALNGLGRSFYTHVRTSFYTEVYLNMVFRRGLDVRKTRKFDLAASIPTTVRLHNVSVLSCIPDIGRHLGLNENTFGAFN